MPSQRRVTNGQLPDVETFPRPVPQAVGDGGRRDALEARGRRRPLDADSRRRAAVHGARGASVRAGDVDRDDTRTNERTSWSGHGLHLIRMKVIV